MKGGGGGGGRSVLNEGKAGRQTAENAEGMEAGC